MDNYRIERITQNILRDSEIYSTAELNIQSICEKLGVAVKSEKMEHGISGMFILKNNKPYIWYNRKESIRRRRFTIAHELGHFVLHKDTPLFIDKKGDKVLYRDEQSSTGERRREREANSFAASILMPMHFIKEELTRLGDLDDPVVELAKIFKVSEQAMTYRLANLGYDIGYY